MYLYAGGDASAVLHLRAFFVLRLIILGAVHWEVLFQRMTKSDKIGMCFYKVITGREIQL
jgi:hypothetical protein